MNKKRRLTVHVASTVKRLLYIYDLEVFWLSETIFQAVFNAVIRPAAARKIIYFPWP